MTSRNRSRLLIADDHLLVAEICKNLLEPEFEVVSIVSDGHALMQAVARAGHEAKRASPLGQACRREASSSSALRRATSISTCSGRSSVLQSVPSSARSSGVSTSSDGLSVPACSSVDSRFVRSWHSWVTTEPKPRAVIWRRLKPPRCGKG